MRSDFSRPDFSLEDAAGPIVAGLDPIVAGIDEVGRGPWAGPVVAAAVVLDRGSLPRSLRLGLDDSKALSPGRREALDAELRLAGARIGLGQADVAEIDSFNILGATMLAMRRAFDALSPGAAPVAAIVDGNRTPALPCPATAAIKGDRRSLSIAAASIVAKVARDRLMTALGAEFPAYGWARNKGYGTAEHARALARHGPTPHHRRSFAPVAQYLVGVARTQ